MNKILIALSLCISVLVSNNTYACDKPEKLIIPNGNAATKKQMVEVQDTIRKYVAEMGIYLECIVTEEKLSQRAIASLSPQAEQNRQDLLSKKYNAAIDEMEEVVLQHNREAKKFREKDKT